ncbi:MAG: Holliday junction branch migration protein RuvA [Proteobacteria bacterium]|nr:Holliday junction branch migration protein RuvA [Pseudomonadota bacterium]
MLAWLEGIVVHIDQNEIVLNTNGIGYQIIVGDNFQRGFKEGEKKAVVIYTSVKEDEIRLFGFESFEARKLFILLLSVNGIGPKVGQKIIDQISAQQIVLAIINQDHNEFLKISGVGKKTAQRVVIDLQGKIESVQFSFKGDEKDQPSGIGGISLTHQVQMDTKSALSNLGYIDREIDKVINRYMEPGITIDELIRKCLSDLNQT